MEILATTPITDVTWYGKLIFAVMVIAALLAFFAIRDHEFGLAAGSCIVVIILVVILLTCPIIQEDKTTAIYTVEITDQEQYKQLIKDGYTFKRIFDNREIYRIQGPIINE